MTLRFGTDGVRGEANTELTVELALALGRAAVRVQGGHTYAIGRDTRESGPMLEAALAAGIAAEGADVELLGVMPTPAVASASARRDVPAAMISASHNPYRDNGIKLFAPGGRKLPDATEERLEAEIERVLREPPVVGDRRPGRVRAVDERGAYEASVSAALEGRRVEGLSVVIDCANGAASATAPELLRSLGAEVVVLHDEPDGVNINDRCGSTHPEALRQAVVEHGAAAGLAFDGDADRVLAVDEAGRVVDGDQIVAIAALDLRARGRLRGDTVVVTVMTNLGFRLAMADHGIEVVETAVGDRHVLEALEERGLSLGGEQSGHVIFRDLATTGDGLLTGLVVLDTMQRLGRPLSDLAACMTRLPQVLVNIAVGDRRPDVADLVAHEVGAVEAELGERGRVLIRPSGTEPVVRVMVEAATEDAARSAAARLAAAVETACA